MSQQPYQSNPYAQKLQHILAALHAPEDEQEQALPDEEAPPSTIHVYPVEGGGVFFSPVPLEPDEPGEEEGHPRVIASLPPAPPRPTDPLPAARRGATGLHPPRLALFVLLLGLFLLLDAADSQLVSLLTPAVTITLTPVARTLTLTSTAPLGRQLVPLTLSQSQSVPTSGHGHQDARAARGMLTFYNGLSSAQEVAVGTILTGQDSVRVATDESVTVPPANPPSFGAVSVPAHALLVGAAGDLQAGDLNATLGSGLYVKNLSAFGGGQDARNFPVVTQADLDRTTARLRAAVTASMTAALQGQLRSGETLYTWPCAPITHADHAVGEEAPTIEVTVKATCTASAYNRRALYALALRLLTVRATKSFGKGYGLDGPITVMVTQALIRPFKVAMLTFTGQGNWVYHIDAARIQALVGGQPYRAAFDLLVHLAGIAQARISGLSNDQALPTDPTHLHVLVVLLPATSPAL